MIKYFKNRFLFKLHFFSVTFIEISFYIRKYNEQSINWIISSIKIKINII